MDVVRGAEDYRLVPMETLVALCLKVRTVLSFLSPSLATLSIPSYTSLPSVPPSLPPSPGPRRPRFFFTGAAAVGGSDGARFDGVRGGAGREGGKESRM